MKRRAFLATCGVLTSGCVHFPSNTPANAGGVIARPVNESEIDSDVKIWEYDDPEIQDYPTLRDAVQRSYDISEEDDEPRTGALFVETDRELEGIQAMTEYSPVYRFPGDAMYVRYRRRIFEVAADPN